MCTLTWLFNRDSDGYSLLFNRDELKTRQRALPPEIKQSANGVSYLAPIDADAGGTWLAVNQYGITVCLLNNYSARQPATTAVHSRGEVILRLAGCRSIQELKSQLQNMDLHFYKGFEIVAFHNDVWHWRWDALKLEEIDAVMPITSSSYDTEVVQKKRQDYFNTLDDHQNLETLKFFHRCHLDDDNHLLSEQQRQQELAVNSVCMHREFSQTVSQCLVNVNENDVAIDYLDGAPCSVESATRCSLSRREVA